MAMDLTTASGWMAFTFMRKVVPDGHHAHGPGDARGPNANDPNTFYLDVAVTFSAENFADGGSITVVQFTDNAIQPGAQLYAVTIPDTAKPGDSATMSFGGHSYPETAPANTRQAVAPPPQPQAALNPRPVVNPNVGAPAPRAAHPSDRQLVTYENNPANPDYRRLLAIPPDQAKGIGLPAFDVASGVPPVGSTVGEGHYDVATGMAYVWDGTHWQPITPRAEIEEWQPLKPYVHHEVVEWKDVLWICIDPAGAPIGDMPVVPSAVWRPLSTTGLVAIPSACDATKGLASIPKLNGAHAIATDTGAIFTLVDSGTHKTWVELYGAVIEQTISNTPPPANAQVIGEVKMFAAAITLPTGWVICDGAAIPAANTAAIAVLGANVPDLTDRFVRGGTAAQVGLSVGATTAAPVNAAFKATFTHHHETALFEQEAVDKGPWGPGRTANQIKAAEGSTTYAYQEDNSIGNSAEGDETSVITSGPMNGLAIDNEVTITGWDAETAPQHYRVIFAVYIG